LAAVLAAILPTGAVNAQAAGVGQAVEAPTIVPTSYVLPAGTPIVVATADDLSSTVNKVGDPFKVVVAYDVVDRGIVVVPKGTTGVGEVTFSTKKGGFGRAGLLGIALRTLDLNGKQIELDGRYREEGKDNGGAAGAVVFAVGIVGIAVTGKNSLIPKGRELKAHIGEDISYSAMAPAVAPIATVPAPANTNTNTTAAKAQPAAVEPKTN
jgi:hypothetical protein